MARRFSEAEIASKEADGGPTPVHISSLIVHAQPDKLGAVHLAVEGLGGEISAFDPAGKLVVVIETDDEAGVTGFADALRGLDGVILANLVFHSIDEPEEANPVTDRASDTHTHSDVGSQSAAGRILE